MRETVSDAHVCEFAYVTEGEVVCFGCGSAYIYTGIYNADELRACREEIAAGTRDEETTAKVWGPERMRHDPETRS